MVQVKANRGRDPGGHGDFFRRVATSPFLFCLGRIVRFKISISFTKNRGEKTFWGRGAEWEARRGRRALRGNGNKGGHVRRVVRVGRGVGLVVNPFQTSIYIMGRLFFIQSNFFSLR